MNPIIIKIPIKVISEANTWDGHWIKKYKRKKAQNIWLHVAMKGIDLKGVNKVTLTRIGPRKMDTDNLLFSLKNIRDSIADKINPGLARGQADNENLITWQYRQEKGEPKEYALKIEFFS